ncbi:MAG: cytochrome b N-terminal domain-containing protein [Candidatus Aminicenantales bacterium]
MNSQDRPPLPDAKSKEGRSRPNLRGRLWKWIGQRTGAEQILRASLDEPIPGGASFAYVFGSGLLFIFLSQIITGVCLALYYAPSPMTAHVSVAYIVKEVAAGAFLRSLHSYGSSAMVVVLALHFLQTFLYGSYKGKRELLWISGGTLALLVLGMTFTGYLLSWDQGAYSAGSVGTDIVGQVPIIGESLRLLLRGGATMGALTISRFFVLHVLVIPALILSFIAIHIFLFRKAGAAGPVNEDPVRPHLPAETFYPKQVLMDMAFVLLVMGVLGTLAHFVPITLGLEANPTNTTYLPRPEWFYLPMFQWLKYWEGWRTVIGVFIVPVILIGLFFLLPFLDRGLERRPWRRPIPVGGVFIVLIGLVWLGMTSRLEDARDPIVAAQLAEQNQQEEVYFYAAFQPYSASSPSRGVATMPVDAAAAQGKGIFDSHGCSGCHGASGGGGVGPALTHITGQYPPAQLTALLKAPTAKMRAAGMVPLTLNADDMKALVSYLARLGGGSAAPAAKPAAPGPSGPSPAEAKPGAAAGPAKAGTGNPAVEATAAQGKSIFDSHGCSGCHGASGGGGVGPALTHITGQYPPAQLTALLKAPTAKMKAAGMVPLTLNADEMKALVSYLAGLGGGPAAPTATPAAPGPSTPSPAEAKPGAAVGPAMNELESKGKLIFQAHGCADCHGTDGVAGTAAAPALAGTNKSLTPALLTKMLRNPTARMRNGGMPPVSLSHKEMEALVAYLSAISGSNRNPR